MTTAPPDTGTPPDTAPAPRAGRIIWRRVLFAGLSGVAGAFGLVHVLGGTMTAWIAGGSAAAAGGGYALYKYPHVRQHYEGPWLARRHARREGKGQKGFSRAWMKNWRQKLPGNPFKGKGSSSGRKTGTGTGRGRLGAAFRRAGSGLRRGARNGLGRGRARRGLGTSAKGSGRRRGASRRTGTGTGRRAGIFRRSGKGSNGSRRGSGGSRRGSGAFRRFRRGSGTPPAGRSRRRSLFHPRGGRRTAPRTAPPGRSRRRSLFHPRGGRRTAPRTPPAGRTRRRTPFHPFGGRRTTPVAGRRHPRSVRHPFGGRRTPAGRRSWRHPFGGPRMGPRRPAGPVRRGWHRIFGTPSSPRLARRAWHRMFGTQEQRRIRRRVAKARRANVRNQRRRVAGTYGKRVRWFAPWRIWTRGGGARASWRRMRARRGRIARRRGSRVPLRHRARNWAGNWLARRRRLRGLGIAGRTPLRLRLRHWTSRGTWRGIGRRLARRFSLRRWLRNRPPPRPLLGGRHRTGVQSAGLHRFGRTRLGQWFLRRDRRRKARWMARQRPAPPVPVPGPPRRQAPSVPARHNGAGSHRTGGRAMAEAREMAEQIREMGMTEFQDSNHVHRTLMHMHEIIAATMETMENLGKQIDELPGVIPEYAEAAHEAAGQLSGVADALQERVGQGITGQGAV